MTPDEYLAKPKWVQTFIRASMAAQAEVDKKD